MIIFSSIYSLSDSGVVGSTNNGIPNPLIQYSCIISIYSKYILWYPLDSDDIVLNIFISTRKYNINIVITSILNWKWFCYMSNYFITERNPKNLCSFTSDENCHGSWMSLQVTKKFYSLLPRAYFSYQREWYWHNCERI